jgi:hypothetical protein
MSDGGHGPAGAGDDLCVPCRMRFDEIEREERELAGREDALRRAERPGLFGELTSSAV